MSSESIISVPVPKDLSGIKTKVCFNLTKRQLICFSLAGATGIPLYFIVKPGIGASAASMILVGFMMPFFFLAMYSRDGFPAERIFYFFVRQMILRPGIRKYQSANAYTEIEDIQNIRKEIRYLVKKRDHSPVSSEAESQQRRNEEAKLS